jgi:hypothetical protein
MWETRETQRLWGTPGKLVALSGPVAEDWRRRRGQMGKNGMGCRLWLPGPVGAGRARESGIFHSSLSSTLAVQRVDRGGRRRGRVRWGLDKEV